MSIRTAAGRVPPLALLAALMLASPVRADDGGDRPLRPASECMDPGRVRSWTADGDRVLIDAGRRHYAIELARGCPELGTHPFLGFISHNPSGRICGDIGDRLVPHGAGASGSRISCPIARLRMIDRSEYAALLQAGGEPSS